MGFQQFSALGGPLPDGVKTSRPDESIQGRWLGIDHARERLLNAWAEHESALAQTCAWLQWTEGERSAHPEFKIFQKLEAKLDRLDKKAAALLRALPTAPASDLRTVIENLSVAERLVVDEDNPIGHGLVERAVRDLKYFLNTGPQRHFMP